MSLIKKLFVFSLVITTVLWSFGGLTVKAEGSYGAGSLLVLENVDGAAVYYIGSDDKKYIFPDGKTYSTWYANFDNVIEVDVAELDMYNDGGTVTYRAGTKLVTHENTAKVYAIGTGGVRHHIPTAAVAEALYGANWGSMVMDVLPGYFSSYAEGAELSDMYPNGTLLQIGEDMYYVMGGDVRPFADADAFEANDFSYDNVLEVEDVDAYGTGESVTGEETGLAGFMPAEDVDGDDVVVADGDLAVSLASATPAQMAIPYNVQGYVYTSLRLSAGDTAVDVTGLTIERTGLGTHADFDTVYVEVDGLRHGTKRTLGSDNETDIYFATATNKITVAANSSVTVDVVADMEGDGVNANGANAGHYNALMVTAIVTDADVTVSYPITGNYMTVNSISVATADITFTGSDADVEIGEDQIEVATMKVDNDSSEDISFESVILENTGTADNTEVTNYTLYDESDSVVAGPVDATIGDYVSFILDEAFVIEDGRSEDFVIKADINKGRTETIILGLEESTDFNATGLTNGYAVAAEDSDGDVTYDIIGGDLVTSEADTNPGTQDVAPQTDDVVFLVADLEALEETAVITASTLTLVCTTDNDCYDLENITAYLDGDVVFGPIDGSDDLTMDFTEDFEVSGTQLFEVTADIGENASGTYSISLDNDAFTAESLEGDALDSINGSADGNLVTVDAAAATLSVDGTYGATQNMVAGDEDFLIGRFILEASDFEGISISSYEITLVTGDALEMEHVDELWISEDDDHDTSVATSTTFNVSQELAAGATKVISVYATIDDDFAALGSNDTIEVDEISIETEGLVSEEENTVTLSTGAQVITVETGSLVLALGADTADEMTVLAGNSYEVAEWNFETENVDYVISEIIVAARKSDNTTNTSAVVSGTLAGYEAIAINGVLTFDTEITVEKDEDLDITLSVLFNDSFNNIASGDAMDFVIIGYTHQAANETATTDVDDDYSETGEFMHVRASDVTVTTAVNDTTLAATTEIMDITFTADAAGDITISTSSFTFNFHDDAVVEGATLTITNIDLLDANDDVVATDTTDYDAYANTSFTTVLSGFAEVIGAGSSDTYTLEITVTGYATDDYINVTMLDDSGVTPVYFGWTDEEATTGISGDLVDGIDSPYYEATK